MVLMNSARWLLVLVCCAWHLTIHCGFAEDQQHQQHHHPEEVSYEESRDEQHQQHHLEDPVQQDQYHRPNEAHDQPDNQQPYAEQMIELQEEQQQQQRNLDEIRQQHVEEETWSNDDPEYWNIQPDGVDVSWPMHYHANRHNQKDERDNVMTRYQSFMKGCSMVHSEEECQAADRKRMTTNILQPPTMRNYTQTGVAKRRAPTFVATTLTEFYNQQHQNENNNAVQESSMLRESWPPSTIYANHWERVIKSLSIYGSSSYSSSSSSSSLSLAGTVPVSIPANKRQEMVHQIQTILEEWCQTPLVATSIQGIREFRRNAVVVPSVNQLPFVVTALVHVGKQGEQEQEEEEKWPLEVIQHDGKRINITTEAGDMVLLEGASVIYGRPYPLKGRMYSEVYFHFEPVGYSQRHAGNLRRDPQKLFEAALKRQRGADSLADQEHQQRVNEVWQRKQKEPPYYVPQYLQDRWEQKYVFVKRPAKPRTKETVDAGKEKQYIDKGVDEERFFHNLAAKGFLVRMKELVAEDPSILTKRDANGWTALHEAARAGHTRGTLSLWISSVASLFL